MSVTELHVKSALSQVIDPNTNKDLITTKSVKNIQILGSVVNFDVELGYPAQSQLELIRVLVESALSGLDGVTAVHAHVHSKIVAHTAQRGIKLMPNVKNIIAS